MFFFFILFTFSSILEETLLHKGDIMEGLTMLEKAETPKDYLLSYVLKKYFTNKDYHLDLIMSKKYFTPIYSSLVLNTNLFYDTPECIAKCLLELGSKTSKAYLENGYMFRPKKAFDMKEEDYKYLLTMVRGLDKSCINTFFNYLDSKKFQLADHIPLLEYLSNKGFSRAHGYLGEAYLYGINKEKSVDKALDLFLKGKNEGDSISCNGIGKILMSSEYEDYTGAKHHFDMVNNVNETDYYLYLLYKDHFKVDQYASFYLARSVSIGYLPALYADGERYFKRGDYDSAIIRLNTIMDYDLTVIDYQEEAFKYFYKNKNVSLLYLLMCIEMGSESSIGNAIYLCEKLKLQDLKFKLLMKQNTQYNKIGDCYFYGEGVAQSYKDAFSYYLCSINTEGLVNLSYMYERGLGVEKNMYKAWETLRRIKINDSNYLLLGYLYVIFITRLVVNAYVIVTLVSGMVAYKMYNKNK